MDQTVKNVGTFVREYFKLKIFCNLKDFFITALVKRMKKGLYTTHLRLVVTYECET